MTYLAALLALLITAAICRAISHAINQPVIDDRHWSCRCGIEHSK